MNKQEFLEGLGLAPQEDKVTEIVVPKDKVEKVIDKPDSINEPSGSEDEINALKSRLSELEEKQ